MVEQFAFRSPKTARLAALLASLGLDGRKVLVLTRRPTRLSTSAGATCRRSRCMPYAEASAYDVLWADAVVVEEGALTGETLELAAEELPSLPEREKRAAAPTEAEVREGGEEGREGGSAQADQGEGDQEGREGGGAEADQGEGGQEERGQAGEEGRAEEEEEGSK